MSICVISGSGVFASFPIHPEISESIHWEKGRIIYPMNRFGNFRMNRKRSKLTLLKLIFAIARYTGFFQPGGCVTPRNTIFGYYFLGC